MSWLVLLLYKETLPQSLAEGDVRGYQYHNTVQQNVEIPNTMENMATAARINNDYQKLCGTDFSQILNTKVSPWIISMVSQITKCQNTEVNDNRKAISIKRFNQWIIPIITSLGIDQSKDTGKSVFFIDFQYQSIDWQRFSLIGKLIIGFID